VPSVGGAWLINEEQAAEEAPEKAPRPDAGAEEQLRKAVAKAEEELARLTKKIDADHQTWERVEKEMAGSKTRIAELRTALQNEEAKLGAMTNEVARIEKEHNGDHDRQEAATKALAESVAAMKDFEGKQDEITKLEKQAAELRQQAEELRKRAEELKKN
jgi:predicted  nucleic acid-binding Zn-ribbon protein